MACNFQARSTIHEAFLSYRFVLFRSPLSVHFNRIGDRKNEFETRSLQTQADGVKSPRRLHLHFEHAWKEVDV